jgi:hypothetical protein
LVYNTISNGIECSTILKLCEDEMKKNLITFALTIVLLGCAGLVFPVEMPKPTYDNSLIFSITVSVLNEDVSEIEEIKSLFGGGLYAPLLFSQFMGVEMDWDINPANSGTGIQVFKDYLDELVEFAREHNVGIHLTLNYGMSRLVNYYKLAKEEDIRNAQWYNDNNLSSSQQAGGTTSASNIASTSFNDLNHVDSEINPTAKPAAGDSIINEYVFTTPSRYARKLRAHLNAKVTAAFAYLKKVQNANPDVIIIVSAPGEAELNFYRMNDDTQYLQTYFCDYSPFAVLEFRDWIKHEGLYADGELYEDEGYATGGSRYQGSSGLSNFNADFGTSFTSWDLKYFNWSLTDSVDTNYTDNSNPDTNIIPVSQYSQDGMMPTSGSHYIAGGFDPPRTMVTPGSDDFYDLWHTFRETMIYHYVKDMAEIARDSGFDKDKYYSHQIPGDYLFGNRPNDPSIPFLNPRYYSSAAPMWTADVFPDTGLGVTLYDVNFGGFYARTTKYGIDAAASMSENWAALEYNPDVIPVTISATLGSVQTLYNEMIKLYNGDPHVISLFKWTDSNNEYQYKDTNRGTAAKQFFDAVKDVARGSITTVFDPKEVEDFTAEYSSTTGLVTVSWSSKIWTDLNNKWTDWGDFSKFIVYRGSTADFTANSGSELARITESRYYDNNFERGKTFYYRVAVLNKNGVRGPLSSVVSVDTPIATFNPVLSVSRNRLNFAFVTGGDAPEPQRFRVYNSGTGVLNWTSSDDAAWLAFTPTTGLLGAEVEVTVDPTGLAAGTYSGLITITAAGVTGSPQAVSISLAVKTPAQDQPPFGEFATPKRDSTVSSSIPVTGWVLDDVGVTSVEIYRSPLTGEGTKLVYIGDALFVEGARPDIEAAFPDYPANYRAGWGYMLLSNFLPNGGNGEFKLYAVARDSSGNKTTLGSKPIICDNANAVKPFGAIDTPAQGGTASGSSFRNHGWALTPMPNSIATNGSKLSVYIDGVYRGHPVYNVYRSDIAGFFPGYANSSGAGGYFDIDTTKYEDGIHTIAWIAIDSAGNSDGIGSRYFSISNLGEERSRGTAGSVIQGLNVSTIPAVPSAPVVVIKGFDKNAKPQHTLPGANGTTVSIKELERVEIHLSDSPSASSSTHWSGFLAAGNQTRPLPPGSTLDCEKGIFYWMPSTGFAGDYLFDFIGVESFTGKMFRKRITISIEPKFGN